MSQGKYSPHLIIVGPCIYNAMGEIAPDYDKSVEYDEKIHFGNYDKDGFDSYGYSAYLADGTFIGCGNGIDRNGYTENEYMSMSSDEFCNL